MINENQRSETDAGPGGTFEGSGGAREATQQTFEQARSAAHERVEDARARADSAKSQAIERIRRVGAALRAAGDGLYDDKPLADYAQKASERVEGIASYLSTTNGRQLVRDTEDFARRKPAVFFGGAFIMGLAAARFLKSSGSDGRGRENEKEEGRWEDPSRGVTETHTISIVEGAP